MERSSVITAVVLMTATGLVAASFPALGQEIEESRTALQSGTARIYGTAEMRHYLRSGYEADGNQESLGRMEPETQLRGLFGSMFLNEKLDLNLLLGATKSTQSPQVKQRAPELTGTYAAYSSEHVTTAPYVKFVFPAAGDGASGSAANTGVLTGVKSSPVETGLGRLTVSGSADLWTRFSNRASDQVVENETGAKDLAVYGLSASSDGSAGTKSEGKKDLNFYSEYIVRAALQATAALTIEPSVWLDQAYVPRYTLVGEDGAMETSYPVKSQTVERFRLMYKATDRVNLVNDAYWFHDGVWEQGRNGLGDAELTAEPRFTNIAMLQVRLR